MEAAASAVGGRALSQFDHRASLRILGLIVARGGSKGVPRKNVAELGGQPLIAWTVQAAKASTVLTRVLLSSEDSEIIEAARLAGCEVPFVRPEELAADSTPGIEPVLHALDALGEEFDLVVLLQPTSPLRTAEDIDAAVGLLLESGASTCVSVTPAAHGVEWMFSLDRDDRLMPLASGDRPDRRQDLAQAYVLNGAVYVARPETLRERRTFLTSDTVAYVMPPERSLDVDTPFDLELVRALVAWRATSDGRPER